MAERPMGDHPDQLLCPSAEPQMADAVIFGLVTDEAGPAKIGYLDRRVPITGEALTLAEPVGAAHIFRMAATCAKSGCRNYGDGKCQAAVRMTAVLEEVVSPVPACAIRRFCAWWHEQGRAACLRCWLD